MLPLPSGSRVSAWSTGLQHNPMSSLPLSPSARGSVSNRQAKAKEKVSQEAVSQKLSFPSLVHSHSTLELASSDGAMKMVSYSGLQSRHKPYFACSDEAANYDVPPLRTRWMEHMSLWLLHLFTRHQTIIWYYAWTVSHKPRQEISRARASLLATSQECSNRELTRFEAGLQIKEWMFPSFVLRGGRGILYPLSA